MGMKAKSTQLKIITGNPGKRPLNHNEPQPEHGLPEIPLWLQAFSLAVENWEYEGKILNDIRVMTHADWGVLSMRCYVYSQLVGLALDVKEEGRTISYQKVDGLGNEFYEVKHNPKAKQIDNMLKEYRTYGSLLGLDPSSRSKLSAGPKGKANDPWENL